MFLHGGWMHLIGNMWFLWIFGDNIEYAMGSIRYVVFYILVGTVGALAQCFSMPASTAPMIGASGAVAGVLGGYLILYPRARVETILPIPLLLTRFEVPAWVFLGLWFLGQFLSRRDQGWHGWPTWAVSWPASARSALLAARAHARRTVRSRSNISPAAMTHLTGVGSRARSRAFVGRISSAG